MPRIRTIKPEFCTSEQVADCSPTARLLFVTMWCFCDDAGRHPASVKRLKMECFPADPFTSADMEQYVDELLAAQLLVEFEHEDKRFWQVTGWNHQKIDKKNCKYGPLKDAQTPLPIVPIRRPFDDRSTTVRRPFDDWSPAEGKGMEGSLGEWNGMEGSGIDDKSPTPNEKPRSVSVSPPSVADVRLYMAEQGYPDDAEAMVDFYSANGWVQGRGKPIKDWKAAVRNWQRNVFPSVGAQPPITFTQQREANTRSAGAAFVEKMKAMEGCSNEGI